MPNASTIDASPTKSFFIDILTRDVLLSDAILDLVDNCIDGALGLRPNRDFSGLWVSIELSENGFTISDNCGGIPAEIAQHYAFRFGRPKEMKGTPGSVGQFGVGMKRSLFKIGNVFEIISTSESSRFEIKVNVPDWKTEPLWEFKFGEIESGISNPAESTGTIIEISDLHAEIKAEFANPNFLIRLDDEIGSKHAESLDNGLAITLNKVPVKPDDATLLVSEEIKPYRTVETFQPPKAASTVTVEIIAGVAKVSDPAKAGWYVSCNGRMILRANKERLTGWQDAFEQIKIPKAHNQFARFRGFVRIRSDDAGLLPWNTTKSGVDSESPIYQKIRPTMIIAMRQIIDFLNRLDREIDSEETPLAKAIESAGDVKLAQVPPSQKFVAPEVKPTKTAPKESRISYSVPVARAQRAKELLGATSLREVGERTFDYFMDSEDDDAR